MSSIGGERIDSTELSAIGAAGDRQFGLLDSATGLPAAPEKDRRWRKALHLTARSTVDDLPEIVFPDGQSHSLNNSTLKNALSNFFGFAAEVGTYAHTGRTGFPLTHYRHQHFPIHFITTATLNQLAKLRKAETIDSRRFRPTFVFELKHGKGFVEHGWIGKHLRLGAINLTAQAETKRCGMTFISQPGIEEDPEILRQILRYNKRNFGIYCAVDNVGTVHVGDELFIEDAPRRQTQFQV